MSRRIAVAFAVTLIAAVVGCGREAKQVVISGGRATPYELHVTRGVGTGAPDVVVWKNRDAVEHTVIFRRTPFEAADLRISVPANGTSRNLVVGRSVAAGRYPYGINPDFVQTRSDSLPDSLRIGRFDRAVSDSGPAPVVIVDE
jgi:hypothetical protein